MRPDFRQCDACGVPAYLHYSDGECRGFHEPPPPRVRAVIGRVVDAVLVGAGRLFYRYPEG